MKSIFENQNELLYTALYNMQNETVASYAAKRSVISQSDMAYEWFKSVDFKIVENKKYLGVVITSEEKKYNSEHEGDFDLIENVQRCYIPQHIINYVESLNNYKHKINTLIKYFKYK